MALRSAKRHITSDVVEGRTGVQMKPVAILIALCLSLAACNISNDPGQALAPNWGSLSACGRC
jgi:hypothetical protein